MDQNEEIVFQNNCFTIVKKEFTKYAHHSYSNSRLGIENKILVRSGEFRFWIYDVEGNSLGGDFCSEYGCKSYLEPQEDVLPIEVVENSWRYLTRDGRMIPNSNFYEGETISAKPFENGHGEIGLIKGLTSYVDVNGRVLLRNQKDAFIPIPDKYRGGQFLTEEICILLDDDQKLGIFDNHFLPLDHSRGKSSFFDSYEKTPMLWAFCFYQRSQDGQCCLLNVNTKQLFNFQYSGVQSCFYKVISDDCLHITIHTRKRDDESSYWNQRYIEKDYYCLLFRNGRFVQSTDDYEVIEEGRLLISHQSQNNGCWSFDGEAIVHELYDEVLYNNDTHRFSLKYNGSDFTADSNARLFLDYKDGVVSLPSQIVAYERITDTLYKIAKFQVHYGRVSSHTIRYGIMDISSQIYKIPCRYKSLEYISDTIIIVCGEDDYSWGIIDIHGGQRMPLTFHEIRQSGDNSLYFQTGWSSSESFYSDYDLMKSVESEDGYFKIPAYYTVRPFYGKKDYGTKNYDHRKFHKGFCVVSQGDNYGLIKQDGEVIVPCTCESIYCIYEGEGELFFALQESGGVTILDIISGTHFFVRADAIKDCYKSTDGDLYFLTSVTTKEDTYEKEYQGLYGLKRGIVFDNEYGWIWPVGDWDNQWSRSFPPGNLLWVYKEEFGLFALAKYDGTILTDFVFKNQYIDKNGHIVCRTNDSYSSEDKQIAIFDNLGRCIIPLEAGAEDYEMLSDEVIKVSCADSNCGFIFKLYNLGGERLTTTDYSYIGTFRDGEAVVNVGGYSHVIHDDFDGKRYGVRRGLFGVISSDYKTLIEPKYSLVRKNCDGVRVVSVETDEGHLYGVVSYDGKEIVACQYKYLGDAYKGQLLFAENGKWNNRGSKREALFTADRTNRWLEGANWGIIDLDQNVLVPASYQYIYRPIDEISVIVNNNKYGFYNYEEKMFFIPQYDFLEAFSEGLCVVGKKNRATGEIRYGYIDKRNHIVIDCVYLKAFHFKDGQANVETKEAYCTINKENQVIYSQDKAEIERWRAEEAEERARAEAEEEDRRQMIEDGLREAFNGDMSNMWNID